MNSTDTNTPTAVQFTREIRDNRGWILLFGILIALLGLAAILFPVIASYAANLTIGVVLTVSGVIDLARSARMRSRKGFWLSLLNGALAVIAGVLLLLFPLPGVLTLTLIVSVFFLLVGTLRVLLALQLRPYDHWGWLLFGGVLAIGLGVLILTQWPAAATWVIGLLVGIDLLFAGLTSMFLALSLPSADSK